MTRATAAIAAAILGTVLAVGIFGADMAKAEDEKHWYFDVENDSNGVVLEFRTQEDGQWSENWLSNRLRGRRQDQARLRDGRRQMRDTDSDPFGRRQLLRCAGRLLQGQDTRHREQHLALEVNAIETDATHLKGPAIGRPPQALTLFLRAQRRESCRMSRRRALARVNVAEQLTASRGRPSWRRHHPRPGARRPRREPRRHPRRLPAAPGAYRR